jgi:hypothetical protein
MMAATAVDPPIHHQTTETRPFSEVEQLPQPEQLAWAWELLTDATHQLADLDEQLAPAFEHVPMGDGTYRSRRTFGPVTLEDVGRYALLADDARKCASRIVELADTLERHILSLYIEQEGAGLVATPIGLESYPDYQRRLARRHETAAADARERS